MMSALKNLFRQKTPAEKPMDPQVAAVALLVEAALSDGVYVNIESDMIAEILLEAFKFDADRADAVLAEGEALADGEKSDIEDAYIRHVASLLHIDDISRAQARQMAEKRITDAS